MFFYILVTPCTFVRSDVDSYLYFCNLIICQHMVIVITVYVSRSMYDCYANTVLI
jgi:hypothetical protein